MSATAYSPSRVALEAAGREPVAVQKAQQVGYCAMCGKPHGEGDLVVPFEPEGSFTDYGLLCRAASKWICGWCAGVWNADFTQKALKTVMCDEGVFPAASNAHIAYWLLNPPSGRWIWVMGDQKRQHIVWRAPVNSSAEVFQIRYGELTLTVRKAHLIAALAAAKRLAIAASADRKVPLKSPFVRLSRDLDDVNHGAIRSDLLKLATTDAAVAADVKSIQQCTAGELWAMTAALYADPADKPAPIFSRNN